MSNREVKVLQIDRIKNERVVRITKDSEYILKCNPNTTGEYTLKFIPIAEDITINVRLNAYLEHNSHLTLKIIFQQVNKSNNFNYLFNGKIILFDDSKAKVFPIIQTQGNMATANHKLSIGGIDPNTIEYLSSKGLSKLEIESIIKSEIDGL